MIRKDQSNFGLTGPNGEWPPIPFGSATIQIWYENLSIGLYKIHFFCMKHGGKKENWMMMVISTSSVLKVQMMQDVV